MVVVAVDDVVAVTHDAEVTTLTLAELSLGVYVVASNSRSHCCG